MVPAIVEGEVFGGSGVGHRTGFGGVADEAGFAEDSGPTGW